MYQNFCAVSLTEPFVVSKKNNYLCSITERHCKVKLEISDEPEVSNDS